jgi:putative ABC transport system permease protein
MRFASFNPTGLMQKSPIKGKIGSLSHKLLVITQFVFSVFFIVGTFVINDQFQFMKKRSLNGQNDQIIYLPFKGEIGTKYEAFKNQLLSLPYISHVTAKNSLPTEVADKTGELDWPGKDPNLDFIIEGTGVDFDYFETLGIKVVNGRSFTEAFTSDNKFAFVLNETAIKDMGLKNPIGAEISLWGYPGRIIGVVEDVNLKSLRNDADGQIFFIIPDYTEQDINFYGVILIKIQEDIPNTLSAIQALWTELNPGIPFDYHFLDEAVDSLYWDEMRLSRLMNYASILSIVICCLGLLGLVIHNSNAKIKEIGIRKINGATILNIMIMLNRDYILWVSISFIIAFPLALILLNKWLQNFTSHVSLDWWIFAISGLVALTIALITINGQIIKVARKNPADVLRYE